MNAKFLSRRTVFPVFLGRAMAGFIVKQADGLLTVALKHEVAVGSALGRITDEAWAKTEPSRFEWNARRIGRRARLRDDFRGRATVSCDDKT
jgi:hypothetical protein